MTPPILIGKVAKGRERSAAKTFASLTRLVALAAMGLSAEDEAPIPRPHLTLIRAEPFAMREPPKR